MCIVRWIAAFLLALAAYGQNFEVGAGRRDITPREPVPMWGYGDRHDALSDGVLDPLYADALVIQAGGKKIAIVGLDLGRAPAEASLQKIRRRIKEQTGIEDSIIAGSHTHHGPVLELTDQEGKGRGRFDAALRYYGQLEDGIVAAIVEANSRLAPARMAVGSVQLEGFNRNRHTHIEPKPSDRELAVMRFDDAAGKPLAILVNFAAHPTMLPARTLKFSADYVGALKAEVPHPSLECREERLRFTARTDFANPLVRAAYEKAFFPELVPNYIDEYADGVRPRLTVALLNGDIALLGVSGEFFSNHAIRLKARARVKQLFFFGYANGYHQYFPTIEAVAEGGYGADNAVSPVAVGAGEHIMNTALIWIYQMLGRIKN
ncbi:MAG: neutral/alkaline non-lysosomal ceramidase N-terminal domain-containing protein [Bryobacteraceae bacterium]